MYKRDRVWADGFESQVLTILNGLLPHLVVLNVASQEHDNHQATDFEIQLVGGTVAVRLRRPRYDYRDLTIRSSRTNGTKTELAKIKEGYAYRYLYGWIDENNRIVEWMLVDLDRVRSAGMLDGRREIYNTDGKTAFIAIPAEELCAKGCLVVWAGVWCASIKKVMQHSVA